MQLSFVFVLLASTTGVIADLHYYGYCYSKIQPVNNNNVCPKKRDTSDNMALKLGRSRIMGRAYGDNAEATKKACAAYRKRNTGSKQWDQCPDCTVSMRHTTDSNYCITSCNSAAKHIGGDELHYYCKQAGADGSDAYP